MINKLDLFWESNFIALGIYFIFGTKISWNDWIDIYFNVKYLLLGCIFDFLGDSLVVTAHYLAVTAGYLLLTTWWLLVVTSAYFKIQGKHPTFSQRASYLSNTSWFDSLRLMRVQGICDNRFKKFIQLYTPFYGYIALSAVYQIFCPPLPPGDDRRINIEKFYLF